MGNTDDFIIKKGVLVKYTGADEEVVIPGAYRPSANIPLPIAANWLPCSCRKP